MSPNGTTPVVTASASTIGLRRDVAPGPATTTNMGTGTAIESRVKCMSDRSLTSAVLDPSAYCDGRDAEAFYNETASDDSSRTCVGE